MHRCPRSYAPRWPLAACPRQATSAHHQRQYRRSRRRFRCSLCTARRYDSNTLKRYPVVDPATGQVASTARLGSIEVTRPLATPVIAPQVPLPPINFPNAAVSLLGFDLPSSAVSPGDTLPLSLYWQARTTPIADTMVNVELRSAEGQTVVQRQASPAGDQAPTSSWQAGDIVRGWHDLVIRPDTPAGVYQLVVSLSANGHYVKLDFAPCHP